MCVKGYLVYLRFYDLSIIFMNCSGSVLLFCFSFYLYIFFSCHTREVCSTCSSNRKVYYVLTDDPGNIYFSSSIKI